MATTAELQETLASACGFTAMELDANRQGRITETQTRTLLAEAASFSTIATLALLPVWFAVAILFVYQGEVATRLKLGGLWLLIGIVIGRYLRQWLRLLQLAVDLALDRKPRCLEGKLHTSVSSEIHEPRQKGKHYLFGPNPDVVVQRNAVNERQWLVIGDEQIAVSSSALRAYHPYSGSTCRVYVTKRSRMLLSFEIVNVRVSRLYSLH